MSSFTPLAQHERALAFDRMVTEAINLLNEPAVKAALGQTAVTLLEVSENAFLPDEVDGLFRTPKSLELTNHLALVPMTEDEFQNRLTLVQPIASQVSRAWGHGKSMTSDFYGIDPLTAPPPANMNFMRALAGQTHDTHTEAETIAYVYSEHDFPEYETLISRPIAGIIIKPAKEHPHTTLLHEDCHAVDFQREAPRFSPRFPGSIMLRTATELRAYSTEAIVYEALGIPLPKNSPVGIIEAVRRQHSSHNTYPYIPTPELMEALSEALSPSSSAE